jgi:hypothetical protein
MNPDMGTRESEIVEGGYRQLTGDELTSKLVDKTLLGEYAAVFRFIVCIDKDGKMEGKNNYGAHHFGQCIIDQQNNTITVAWDAGWDNTTNRAYDIDGKIKLFDVGTGQWRTTFYDFTDGCNRPLISPQ